MPNLDLRFHSNSPRTHFEKLKREWVDFKICKKFQPPPISSLMKDIEINLFNSLFWGRTMQHFIFDFLKNVPHYFKERPNPHWPSEESKKWPTKSFKATVKTCLSQSQLFKAEKFKRFDFLRARESHKKSHTKTQTKKSCLSKIPLLPTLIIHQHLFMNLLSHSHGRMN